MLNLIPYQGKGTASKNLPTKTIELITVIADVQRFRLYIYIRSFKTVYDYDGNNYMYICMVFMHMNTIDRYLFNAYAYSCIRGCVGLHLKFTTLWTLLIVIIIYNFGINKAMCLLFASRKKKRVDVPTAACVNRVCYRCILYIGTYILFLLKNLIIIIVNINSLSTSLILMYIYCFDRMMVFYSLQTIF